MSVVAAQENVENINVLLEVDNLLLSRATNLTGVLSQIQVREKSNIFQLLEEIGLDKNYICFITVNEEIRPLNQILQKDDKVALYPHVIGG